MVANVCMDTICVQSPKNIQDSIHILYYNMVHVLMIIAGNAKTENLIHCPKTPYSGFCLRGPISAKHQFLCPAVISAIIISVKQSYY